MDLEVVRPVRSKGISTSFTEDVCEVMIFFRNSGKVYWSVGDSSRTSTKRFEVKPEITRARKSGCSKKRGSINERDGGRTG
jgi:hypothetical protein